MPTADVVRDSLEACDGFVDRHVGPSARDVEAMLALLGLPSLEALVDRALPAAIRTKRPLELPPAHTETEILAELREIAGRNRVCRSYLGLGYHGCLTPPVIRRNLLENPGWYTQYTPYQAEISQGRLEALFNFQTMIADLTAMEIANASLLDEATAAAESMTLCKRAHDDPAATTFFVSEHCHPQTIEVVRTRARPLGIEVAVGNPLEASFDGSIFGALLQIPASDGAVVDLEPLARTIHDAGARVVVATDPLALVRLRPPGELGADVVLGSAQRFGVPLFYGGPHAAFMACRKGLERKLPGRIVGLTRDAEGHPALRLALQTREQHIRREKATSNICTAQVLLAVVAATYAVYHGPEGLRRIARRVHRQAVALASALKELGHRPRHDAYFDTIRIAPGPRRSAEAILAAAREKGINLRPYPEGDVGVALDETVTTRDLEDLVEVFGGSRETPRVASLLTEAGEAIPPSLRRTSDFLGDPVFHRHHTEMELQRYLRRLEGRDLSLTSSMISLGSCTMKLNAAAEMEPITWEGFAGIHPFAPPDQAEGYRILHERLERWLAAITGFEGISLQPNAGSQGEYTGMLVIRAWHASRGEAGRDVCLIPTSAHGTNPASATLAGLRVQPVRCDEAGNIDLDDLREKAAAHRDRLAAIMVTYPSTHGVFEESIRDLCAIVHEHGGQVYLDGANLNALVGLCRPAELGADVCHLNLHKTFCIPHGGGGPGVGPIGVARHLAPFLPGHPLAAVGGAQAIGPVAAAPWGSPGVLPISYAYIALMGSAGLTHATKIAILNANYVAHRLDPHFPVLYKGRRGLVAHECIVDLRPLEKRTGIDATDVAKRLMDYGFHAPTLSFPVPGTLMIEPTESESIAELDRFCEAMIAIREEIREVEEGRADRKDNLLKGAPHTATQIASDSWDRPYSRERAAFPNRWTCEAKFWPYVSRIDNVYGDRHLACCWPVEDPSGDSSSAGR